MRSGLLDVQGEDQQVVAALRHLDHFGCDAVPFFGDDFSPGGLDTAQDSFPNKKVPLLGGEGVV